MPALPQEKREAIVAGLRQGLRGKAIAGCAGVSLATVFKYGKGITRPQFVPASKICRACGATFKPYEGQPSYKWRQRVVCGRGCSGRLAWSKR